MILHAPSSIACSAFRAVTNGLIQANRSLKRGLELSVQINIIMGERLLNHHQIELVQLAQVIEIRCCIGRVGIDHQGDLWKSTTHLPHYFGVPTGFDLDLYPLVSRSQFFFDLSQ